MKYATNPFKVLAKTLVISPVFDSSANRTSACSTRSLKLETLENRELLSATTWQAPATLDAPDSAAIILSAQPNATPISLASLDAGVERIEATFATIGSNRANIEWTRVDGATKYYLMSCTSSDAVNYSAWTGMKYVDDPGDASKTVATQLTLTVGKYYKFRVRAVTASGVTEFTETAEPIVAAKPDPPVITRAVVDHATGLADVEFQTVDNANLYRLDYTFDDGATWQFAKYVGVGEGESTSTKIYIDTDATSALVTHKLNANKTYYFRVRAANDCGASDYAVSDPISYKGATAPAWVSAQEQFGTHYATITWDASDSATEYLIQATTNGGASWSGVKKASADEFTYDPATDTYSYTYFISTGKTYQYRIRAYNELGTDGSSTVSNEVKLSLVGDPENFTVAGAVAVNPTNYPTGERYSKVTVTLNWDAADNAVKYVVKYSKDGGDWKLLKNINDPSATSVTFGAVAGSYYNFSIMAVNSLGGSEVMETGVYGVYKTALNRVDVVAGEPLVATTVAPKGVTTAYQWQYRTAEGEWSDIPGANDSSYTPNAQDVANQYWIRVLVAGTDDDCLAGSYVAEALAAPVVESLNPPSEFMLGEYNPETHALPMSWVDNSDNEDGFYVEYSTDAGQNWAKAAWLVANTTERTGAVYEGKSYQFRIRAYNASGYSPWAYSDVMSFATTITASGENKTTLTASVDFASGDVDYVWQQGYYDEEGVFQVVETLDGNGDAYVLTGNETGVIRVIATDSQGQVATDDIALLGAVTLSGDYDHVDNSTGYYVSEVGAELTATVEGDYPDGTYSYVWLVDGQAVDATGATYVTTASDIGKTITVKAVGDGENVGGAKTADEVYSIIDTLVFSATLTSDGDTYTVNDDFDDRDVTVTWEVGHFDEDGEFVVDGSLDPVEGNPTQYINTGEVDGKMIRVTIADDKGHSAVDTIAVLGGVTLYGDYDHVDNSTGYYVSEVGAELTATVEGDYPDGTYSYVWLVDGQAVDATGATYVTTASDIGKTITVKAVGDGVTVGGVKTAAQTYQIIHTVVDTPSLCVTIPGDVVDPNDGEISLREAILYAAQYPELGNQITFAPWLANQTITVTNGQLAVNQTLTFNGAGQNITISGESKSRIFTVSASNVLFDGITLANGSATQGAAIYLNSGSVTVKNGAIRNNKATNGAGSAVYVNSGTVTIDSSKVMGNSGKYGTIFVKGCAAVNLVNSLVAENTATSGGAVHAVCGATLRTLNATIYNNAATYGGAVYVDGACVKMYNTIVCNNGSRSWYVTNNCCQIETYNCVVSQDYTSLRQGACSSHNNVVACGAVLDANYRPYYYSAAYKSVAINAGNNSYANYYGLTTDLAGKTRIANGTVDVGCYETQYTQYGGGCHALLDAAFENFDADELLAEL